jgi:putative ABC transport system ATP-binding protein
MTIIDLTKVPPSRKSMAEAAADFAAHPVRSGLAVRDLVIEYTAGTQTSRPISGLNFNAEPGSITLLLGPSGCGKTSVLSCLGALMRPTSGSIMVGETAVHELDRRNADRYRTTGVGIVFQSFELLPSLTAQENVMMVLRAAGVPRKAAAHRSQTLLTDLGLGDRLNHKPEQLSGGQQQRVAIARAIALDPSLILADEPTAHLDHGSVAQVLDLHRRMADEGRMVVVSTHDDRMLEVATQVLELSPRPAANQQAMQPGRVGLAAGETLIRQGDPGVLVYVVIEGRLSIERSEPGGGPPYVTECGPGEHVGEMAPLFNLPRSATVRAITDVVVEGMTITDFRRRFGITNLMVNSDHDEPAQLG